MSKIRESVFSPKILEFLRYGIGCGCNFVIKTGLSSLFNLLGLCFSLSYLLSHCILLFCSFFYHHFITFQRQRFEGAAQFFSEFFHYFLAVVGLKVLDFSLVVLGCRYWEKILLSPGTPVWKQQMLHAAVIAISTGFVFLLRYFVFRKIFRRRDFCYYTGPQLRKVFLVRAADADISGNAASGGMVTALLSGALQRKEIDGAVVTEMNFCGSEHPEIRAKIIRTAAELRRTQGSIYTDFPFLSRELMEEIESFPGQLAVVGLPCQLRTLDGFLTAHPAAAEKIVLKIGLFCGHTSKPELLKQVFRKKEIDPSQLLSFRFRLGHWRGYAKAEFCGGETKRWPTAFYNLYQNLFIASPQRCFVCRDHFAESADISTGDVWCLKYRKAPFKPSMTALRTERGEGFFRNAVDAGDLIAEEKTPRDLFAANSRSVIFHKATAAKAAALKKYGISIPVPPDAAPARWNEQLAARIIGHFSRLSPEEAMQYNRRYLKFWLYVMKALTSF